MEVLRFGLKNNRIMEKKDIIPLHLGHHPIVGISDYYKYDGFLANKETDVRVLSVGIAQWDKESKEISAKVFRYSGKRWSPQSEELPPHRCIDLCCLIVQCFQWSKSGVFYEELWPQPSIIDEKRQKELQEYYEENQKMLIKKMENLHSLLGKYLYDKE